MNPYQPFEAEIVERIQETPNIFSWQLRLCDEAAREAYHFAPGQFNMLYLYGVGEVAISIVSDMDDPTIIGHTIRVVGRVTQGMAALQKGDRVGLRGPYGRGWPLEATKNHDVMVVTGGLGCAPVIGAINHIVNHRADFGKLSIIQGVKHSADLIWREKYTYWEKVQDTQVLLSAEHGGAVWPGRIGLVTEVFEDAHIVPENTVVMMCGPEGMMQASVKSLLKMGVAEEKMYLNMERNMHCAIGHCGHCQLGGAFVCQQGPIFAYPEIKALLGVKGF